MNDRQRFPAFSSFLGRGDQVAAAAPKDSPSAKKWLLVNLSFLSFVLSIGGELC